MKEALQTKIASLQSDANNKKVDLIIVEFCNSNSQNQEAIIANTKETYMGASYEILSVKPKSELAF